ncbi:MAG: NGG1p interacting factor 3 protein [Planctomycetaceae bacterium]|nr:NGG1p interacting factor 3 protein [Planctomycetaceae bacterium]
MTTIADITHFLSELAPLTLAESWDNVGLLIGDTARPVDRILTCLTVTPDVVAEAVALRVDLIVSHHPMLFKPIQRLVASDPQGSMLLSLIGAGIALYSPHTAFDSASAGINQQLAERFGLLGVHPLRIKPNPVTSGSPLLEGASGAGRYGDLPQPCTLDELCESTKQQLNIASLQRVGSPAATIRRLGIACGAAAEFIPDALAAGCDALLTGEARFHDCLRARDSGLALILPGHYATERPAVETLADILQSHFADLTVSASVQEHDPVEIV